MSLNSELMDWFKDETGEEATYERGGSTYHTLRYVDWLEDKFCTVLLKIGGYN